MNKIKSRFFGLLCVLILGSLFGCSSVVRERTPRLLDEWGRAKQIGFAERGGEIGLTVHPDGMQAMVAFFGKQNTIESLQIQIVDELGIPQYKLDLPKQGNNPQGLQLVSDENGATLSWRVRQDDIYELWIQTISWGGSLVGEAVLIETDSVSRFDDRGIRWHKSVRTDETAQLVLWLEDRNTLYATRIEGATTTTTVLQEDVLNADIMIDNAGAGQLVWSALSEDTQFFYHSILDLASLTLSDSTQGIELYAGDDVADPETISGPAIALEDDTIYVMWSRVQNTPFGAYLRLFYSHFPYGGRAETASPPQLIDIPGFFPPVTTAQNGYFPYQELSLPVSVGVAGLAYPSNPALPINLQGAETAFSTSVYLQTRHREDNQPLVVYLRDGAVLGYQVLTWTDLNSGKSVLVSDNATNLYISWIDARRNAENPVYLMSTNSVFVEANSGLNSADYQVISTDMLNRLVRSVALVFVIIPWLLIAFFCFLAGILLARGDIYEPRSHRIFALSTLVYLAGKYATGWHLMQMLPNAHTISPDLYSRLVYIIPILILLGSLLLVWLFYIRRTKDVSAVRWFIALIVIDYISSILFYSLGYFE